MTYSAEIKFILLVKKDEQCPYFYLNLQSSANVAPAVLRRIYDVSVT